MRRTLRLAALTTGVLVVIGASTAGATGHRATLHFASATRAPAELFGLLPDGTPDPMHCGADGRCQLLYYLYDSVSGDVVGTLDTSGTSSVHPLTGVGDGVGISRLSGRVRGCANEGTADLRITVRLGVEPGRNAGTFAVIAGSGTGGLAKLRGSGTIVATQTGPTSFETAFEGNLRCKTG